MQGQQDQIIDRLERARGLATIVICVGIGAAIGLGWSTFSRSKLNVTCEVVEIVKEKRRVIRKRSGSVVKKEGSSW